MIPQSSEGGRRVFAIIVHHGPSYQTIRLVRQLASGIGVPRKIIVVDHGEQQLQLEHNDSSVCVVRPTHNRGYGAGINIGLGVLTAADVQSDDIVVCMNNDVVVSSDTIEKVGRWWHDHPKPALIGAKAGAVNLLTGRTKITNYELRMTNYETPYIHGAFFAAPYNVFMRAKGYPDHFFLYWEDVLFSQRVHKRGIPLHVVPKLGVSHGDDPKQQSAEQLYYLVRNGAVFLESHTPVVFQLYWKLLNDLRILYHRLVAHNKPVFQALGDARRGITGPHT